MDCIQSASPSRYSLGLFYKLNYDDSSLQIISGQYVCPNTNTGSPQVEVEIIGIPVDCCRQRTKIVQRNSLNPIWNDTFFFRVRAFWL